MSDASYVLHVWPAKWNLHSLDPACLATVMYLQLTIPGRFKVAYTINPDTFPNSQLPCLTSTRGQTVVSTFSSIVTFVTTLAMFTASGAVDLDAFLTDLKKVHKIALSAHLDLWMPDLVSYMLYGNHANFWELTNLTLASEMLCLEEYHAAGLIEEAYGPLLEAAALSDLPSEEENQNQSPISKGKGKQRDDTDSNTVLRAFEREKLVIALDAVKILLARASYLGLNGNRFLFGDRPTTLDVYLAAHVLLLADPPLPDAALRMRLTEDYQQLIDHARHVQAEVARAPPYEVVTAAQCSMNSLVLSDNRVLV